MKSFLLLSLVTLPVLLAAISKEGILTKKEFASEDEVAKAEADDEVFDALLSLGNGTAVPTFDPSSGPTPLPTIAPTYRPTVNPTFAPTNVPTSAPTGGEGNCDGVDEWSSGSFYQPKEVIQWEEKLYVVLKRHKATDKKTPRNKGFYKYKEDCEEVEEVPGNCDDVDEWESGTTYKRDDEVQYKGVLYKCKRSHNSSGRSKPSSRKIEYFQKVEKCDE